MRRLRTELRTAPFLRSKALGLMLTPPPGERWPFRARSGPGRLPRLRLSLRGLAQPVIRLRLSCSRSRASVELPCHHTVHLGKIFDLVPIAPERAACAVRLHFCGGRAFDSRRPRRCACGPFFPSRLPLPAGRTSSPCSAEAACHAAVLGVLRRRSVERRPWPSTTTTGRVQVLY